MRKAGQTRLNASAGNGQDVLGKKFQFGRVKGDLEVLSKKVKPRERNPCASKFEERILEETSRQEECARKAAWDLTRKKSSKPRTRAAFHSPVEIKTQVLVSKNTEGRVFVGNLGASMHMLSKKDLSSDEMDTLRRSRTPTTVVTADGEVQTNEEAHVYVHDLDLFVTMQLLDEPPAVLSLGKLCSEHGCSYEWKNGETPRLTKNEKTIACTMDNIVPLVVPELSSSSSSSSANSSGESERSSDPVTTRTAKQHAGNRCRKILTCCLKKPWTSTARHSESRGPGDACASTFL